MGTSAGTNAGTVTLTITGNGDYGDSATKSFVINKANQDAPAAPTAASVGANSITLVSIAGAEYSIDGSSWQDEVTFVGLEAGVGYTFYARLKADGNHNASPAASQTITTLSTPSLAASPSALDFGEATVNSPVTKTVTVGGTNLTGNISYALTGDVSAFSVTETSWIAATGGTLQVTFEPVATTGYNAALTFSSTGASDVTVNLTGSGKSGSDNGGGDTPVDPIDPSDDSDDDSDDDRDNGWIPSGSDDDDDDHDDHDSDPTPAVRRPLSPAEKWMTAANWRNPSRESLKFGVRVSAWEALTGSYYHDSIRNNVVEVRTYFDDPSPFTADSYVSGWTTVADVDRVRATFENWFANEIRVIHFDRTGLWEHPVRVAAKVDLAGWDTTRLAFYYYDPKANLYRRLANPAYWIDANGYLRFTTEYAGEIIISEGELTR